MISSFRHAGVVVKDMEAAIRFYCDYLEHEVIVDFIEKGVERGAPKQLEWRAAFGLMVTLVWLYLEILKLLAKLRSR